MKGVEIIYGYSHTIKEHHLMQPQRSHSPFDLHYISKTFKHFLNTPFILINIMLRQYISYLQLVDFFTV